MKNEDYIDIYEDFKRMCPWYAAHSINWEPIDLLKILVELDNGEAVVYDGLFRTYRLYRSSAAVFEPVCPSREDQWRKEFSNRLYRQMALSGHTQDSLAYAAGISLGSVNRYLNQASTPNAWNIVRLARALDCDVGYLIDFD